MSTTDHIDAVHFPRDYVHVRHDEMHDGDSNPTEQPAALEDVSRDKRMHI